MISQLTTKQISDVINSYNTPNKHSNIFTLALLTRQRIGDIVSMKRSEIKDGKLFVLFVKQSKTGVKIATSVHLTLNVINLCIADGLDK